MENEKLTTSGNSTWMASRSAIAIGFSSDKIRKRYEAKKGGRLAKIVDRCLLTSHTLGRTLDASGRSLDGFGVGSLINIDNLIDGHGLA
jgi:hypothetical protein